jgi:hypothetical protein
MDKPARPIDLDAEPPAPPAAPGPVGPAPEPPRVRPQARRHVALLVIGAATAQILGFTTKTPSILEANDRSRWCTVWSLVERGSYIIDEAPWQPLTQDKVRRPNRLEKPAPDASALTRFEYAVAPASWKEGEPALHYYSSKPPLLSTIIAGLLYPFRVASGVPIETVYEEPRNPVNRAEEDPEHPGKYITRTIPAEERGTVKWPVHVYYFKPIIILFNVVPFFVMLVLFARLLDRHAANDWAWFFSLVAAAWGTLLLAFDQTLNNHTVAAYSAFFAIYPTIRIFNDGRRHWGYFASAGFWAAFCACNELPAALFGILLFLLFLVRFPAKTLAAFVPLAIIPCVAFLATQLYATGQFKPVYEEFGTKSYEYELSYWQTPLEFDYFNKHPEPRGVYLFHMTFGHHGIFSLTPIFLFSMWGMLKNLAGGWRRLSTTAWLTLALTAAMITFYALNPLARNYGGSTQGLRWIFWVIPLWLVMLPFGVSGGERHASVRWLSLLALCVSVFSVGYAMRHPWSHPWILDLIERLRLYHLER